MDVGCTELTFRFVVPELSHTILGNFKIFTQRYILKLSNSRLECFYFGKAFIL